MRQDSPSIVFTADLHFGELPWKYRTNICGDAERSFGQIVDFCCEHRASALALGGDIFDIPKPTPEPNLFLRDQFDRLQAADIPVVYILGQHEKRQDWAKLHRWPVHLHEKAFDVDDFVIYGFDYLAPEVFLAAYAAPPRPEPGAFLLCHQSWQEFMGDKEEKAIAMDQLPYAVNLLTGDFHTHRLHRYRALDGSEGVAFSPGSTHARDTSEDDAKRFFAIYPRDGDGCIPCVSVELKTRTLRRYKITNTEEAEAFLAGINQLPLDDDGPDRAIIDVTYYTDIDGFGSRVARALEGRCHFFPKPKDRRRETRAPSAVARRAVADRGWAGALQLITEPGPTRDISQRLLDAPDAQAELAAMEAEYYESAQPEPQEVA
jgi:hypothetical protein